MFAQALVDGLVLGAIYSLVAIGLALIFGVMRVPSFAHGEIFTLGAYVSFFFLTLVFPSYYLSLLISPIVVALFALVFYPLLYKRMIAAGKISELVAATYGVAIFLRNGIQAIFGAKPRNIWNLTPQMLRETVDFGLFSISNQRILILVGAVLSFVALTAFMKYTRVGKGLRAVSSNREAASLMGIDTDRFYLLSLGMGFGLAALGAVLSAPIFSVNPNMGVSYLLKAFIIVIVGGMGNILGAFVVSFALGVSEGLVTLFLPFQLKDIFGFIVVLVLILFKPEGLLSEK